MRMSLHWTAAILSVAALAAPPALRASDALSALLDPYFRIHAQLTDDVLDGVKADAAVIAREAKAMGDETIAAAARELEQATDMKSAREAFGKLSDAIIGHAQAVKMSLGSNVNTAYCPMVKKSWVQKGESIKNPYGKSMTSCGEIKKKT
jgi:hypothetical protein